VRLLLIVLMGAVLFAGPAVSAPSHPLGCADPDIVSKALKGISNRDWNEISETNLSSMWPTEISPVDCNAGACQTLGREDRIINNKCECCELFLLQVDRDNVGQIKERLQSMVIHYSVTGSDEILAAAKKFARAMGLSDADAATIKRQARQQFEWDVDRGRQHELAVLTVEVTHQRQMWQVYLFLAHHPK
jgi:hypothetical protein